MSRPGLSIAPDLGARIREEGFALRKNALGPGQLGRLLEASLPPGAGGGTGERRDLPYAARNLLWDSAGFGALCSEMGLDRLASEALGSRAFPISATFFDKNPGSNWKVPAHQDVQMPVMARVNAPYFERWTIKGEVNHVEPPGEVLERLIALRVHFDDCPASNGALAVVPGSHRRGRLPESEITRIPLERFIHCPALAGDVLYMKPLLVHRSAPAGEPIHRRVLHLVYATGDPGEGVRWRPPA